MPYYCPSHSGKCFSRPRSSESGDLSAWTVLLEGERGFLHKEMNLGIKSFYEVLSKNEIYPPWAITFQPPPNLMTNPHQIEIVVCKCRLLVLLLWCNKCYFCITEPIFGLGDKLSPVYNMASSGLKKMFYTILRHPKGAWENVMTNNM